MAELNMEIMYNNNAIKSLINIIYFKDKLMAILILVNLCFALLNFTLLNSVFVENVSIYVKFFISCMHIIINTTIGFYSLDTQ